MSGIKPNKMVYSDVLVQLGEKYPQIVVADADVSCSTGTKAFGKKFPDRFYNFGAAEQNMISAVAGMASCGLMPFASTFAVFASMRACDQVRQSIAYTNLNVKIVANNAGLENNGDGVTHQALEDISIMRGMPNMTVMCPSDNTITAKMIHAAASHIGPVYIRLGRHNVTNVHSDGVDFQIGKMIRIVEGNDLTIIATGRMVEISLDAIEQLKAKNYSVALLECHTIKPIDKEAITKAAMETGRIITCEDHSMIGGLGSAVCEVLSENTPIMVKRIGVNDIFARSARDYKDLYYKYGLTAENIVNSALELLK